MATRHVGKAHGQPQSDTGIPVAARIRRDTHTAPKGHIDLAFKVAQAVRTYVHSESKGRDDEDCK